MYFDVKCLVFRDPAEQKVIYVECYEHIGFDL